LRKLLTPAPPELRARYMAGLPERRWENPRAYTIEPEDLLARFRPLPDGEEGGREGVEMPSFDRFRVVNRSDPFPETDGELTFRREGLGWRLVAMKRGFEEFPEGSPHNSWFDRLLLWLRHRD
jgi:hypothetical protein